MNCPKLDSAESFFEAIVGGCAQGKEMPEDDDGWAKVLPIAWRPSLGSASSSHRAAANHAERSNMVPVPYQSTCNVASYMY